MRIFFKITLNNPSDDQDAIVLLQHCDHCSSEGEIFMTPKQQSSRRSSVELLCLMCLSLPRSSAIAPHCAIYCYQLISRSQTSPTNGGGFLYRRCSPYEDDLNSSSSGCVRNMAIPIASLNIDQICLVADLVHEPSSGRLPETRMFLNRVE